MVPNQVQQMVAARLEGRAAPASGGQKPQPEPATQAPPEPPRGPAPAVASSTVTADDSAEGTQLDAARADLRQAEAIVRQLRTSPPGLKAGPEARARHAAHLQQAERDVELARVAEQSATQRWARATEGSEFTRAAMGRNTAQ